MDCLENSYPHPRCNDPHCICMDTAEAPHLSLIAPITLSYPSSGSFNSNKNNKKTFVIMLYGIQKNLCMFVLLVIFVGNLKLKNMKRESGYYWVRVNGNWSVALFFDASRYNAAPYWLLFGRNNIFYDNQLDEIGDKIEDHK